MKNQRPSTHTIYKSLYGELLECVAGAASTGPAAVAAVAASTCLLFSRDREESGEREGVEEEEGGEEGEGEGEGEGGREGERQTF